MAEGRRAAAGGSLRLLEFVEEHRSALVWDFRRYLGEPLDSIGRRGGIRFGEAQTLILELMRETGSHLYAEIVGLDLAASQSEIATIRVAQDVADYLRKPDSRFEIPGPWRRADPNADVTPERRAELEVAFEEVSAFPGL